MDHHVKGELKDSPFFIAETSFGLFFLIDVVLYYLGYGRLLNTADIIQTYAYVNCGECIIRRLKKWKRSR